MNEPQTTTIVNPQGKPARPTAESACQCGAGADRRVLANGFGPPRTVCGQCGRDTEDQG